MVPEAEVGSCKVSVVYNRVEPARGAVRARSARAIAGISRRIKKRSAIARPIFVYGKFQSRHLRVDAHTPSRDGVEVIVPERLIEGIADVDASDVPVTCPSQIVGTNVVRMNRAIHHRP